MKTCETCKFWDQYAKAGDKYYQGTHTQDIGFCRAKAPVFFGDGDDGWPTSVAKDWCGEHQPKDSEG